MTEIQRASLYVKDMLTYSALAQDFIAGVAKEEFEANVEKQFAVLRALEVVGEAAKSVPEEIRLMAPAIRWKQIAGMRDKLIHHYFGVKLDTVRAVATHDVPELIIELEKLVTKFDADTH